MLTDYDIGQLMNAHSLQGGNNDSPWWLLFARCVERAATAQHRAEYEDLKQTMHNMARNHALHLEAARMDGVHSVQEQTAVIVRAALELLEAVEGCDAFPPEKMTAFRRVFGA